jgi:hypothetical protein
MKTFTTGFTIVVLLLSNATITHASEPDIAMKTRDQSALLTQYDTLVLQLEKLRALLAASVVTTQTTFTISVDKTAVVSKPMTDVTKKAAQAQCEAVAYDTENMWKLVTCTFGSEVLYRDVFIAG